MLCGEGLYHLDRFKTGTNERTQSSLGHVHAPAWKPSHRIPLLCLASKNTLSSLKVHLFTLYVMQPLCFLLHLLYHLTPKNNILGIFNFFHSCGLCVCVFSSSIHCPNSCYTDQQAQTPAVLSGWFVL
uniref:Uncharacterized protein n=1 Tax=Pipistrellus kuhlii TaxID=59472 RepID=A0A7J7VBW5_PIPKU|nr:hypothetical protein mPipKuh1_008509 [Pipistrellus kuhlii]